MDNTHTGYSGVEHNLNQNTQIKHMLREENVHCVWLQKCTNHGCQVPRWLHLVWWCLMSGFSV